MITTDQPDPDAPSPAPAGPAAGAGREIEPGTDTEGGGEANHGRSDLARSRLVMVVALSLVLLPVGAALVHLALGGPWIPTSDTAIIEVQVAGMPSHVPQFGVYSRFGFHHPGPALFVTLAPSYWLFGPKGLLVGAGLINAGSLAGVLLYLRRRGGDVLVAGGALVLLLFERSVSEQLIDPWNPWVSILPFALAIVLAWSVLCRDWWALPVLAGVTSWLVQAHVGYLLPAGTLVAGGVGFAIVEAVRRRTSSPATDGGAPAGASTRTAHELPRRRPRIALVGAVTVAVIAAMWAIPLLEQVRHDPGNLTLMLRGYREPQAPVTGWVQAFGIVERVFGQFPWISGGLDLGFVGEVTAGTWWWLLPIGGATVVSAAWALRRGQRDAVVFQALLVVMAVAGYVSVSRIIDQPYNYLYRWLWIVNAFLWLGAAWSLWSAWAGGRRNSVIPPGAATGRDVRSAVTVLAVPCALACLVATSAAWRADLPEPHKSEAVLAMLPAVEHAIAGREPVLIGVEGSTWGEYQAGVVAELARRGYDVMVPDHRSFEFGDRLAQKGREPSMSLVVSVDQAVDERLRRGEAPLALWDPLTADERLELLAIRAKGAKQFGEATNGLPVSDPVSEADRARAQELGLRGDRVAIFETHP